MQTPDHIDDSRERPLEAWIHQGRPCLIYDLPVEADRQAINGAFDEHPTVRDMYETAWRGYTTTDLSGDATWFDVRVYGGLTWGVTDGGWLGFDTMHGFGDAGPQSLEEMKAEVESMVDQLIGLESDAIDDNGGER